MTISARQRSRPIEPEPNRTVLAIDGHDGSGKTTLARELALNLGAVYARPLSGQVGSKFLQVAEAGQAEDAIAIAQAAVAHAIKQAGNAKIIVLDRCWITVFSVIPAKYFYRWQVRPPTLICWSNLKHTLERLQNRNEARQPEEWHRRYLKRYAALAKRFGCTVVRTDELDERETLKRAHAWALSFISGNAALP